jgi:hypothetical protein
MKPKVPITEADFRDMLTTLGINPDEDFSDLQSEDLSAIPKDQWYKCCEVTPPAAILRYLQSGDTLTHHTINMMEIAIEKTCGVDAPWYITSMRDGTEEDGNLSVRYFYLLKEED